MRQIIGFDLTGGDDLPAIFVVYPDDDDVSYGYVECPGFDWADDFGPGADYDSLDDWLRYARGQSWFFPVSGAVID